MRKTGKIGVAQLILRQSQHLAALSVKDDVFVLTLLRLADDLAATDSVKTPSAKGLRDSELQLAARLVDGLAGAWKPEQYKDRYAANLSAIIAAKVKGKGAKPRLGAIGPAEPKAEVADLMERLRQSLSANTNAQRKSRGARRKREAAGRAPRALTAAPPEPKLPIPSPRKAGRGLGRGDREASREVAARSENGRRGAHGGGMVGTCRRSIRMPATARSSPATRASTGSSSSA